jgi:ERCC4-type nuclease
MRDKPIDKNSNYLKHYTIKPTPIPEGFVLVQDTREQRPLFARIPKGLTVASNTLTDGDYSVKGFEDLICFERKSMDLFPYCSSEREKTVKKMTRFKSMEFVGLIVEMKESELFQFQQHSAVHPEVVRAALISFEVRYGVHIYYGSRENCARWLLDRAVKFYNIKKTV